MKSKRSNSIRIVYFLAVLVFIVIFGAALLVRSLYFTNLGKSQTYLGNNSINHINQNNTCTFVFSNRTFNLTLCNNVVFANGSHNNIAVCSNKDMAVNSLGFTNFSSNNTINNCTINRVYEDNSGINFIFGGAIKNYSIVGKTAGIVRGYYIRFIPHLQNGSIQTGFPNIVQVISLSGHNPALNRSYGHYYGIASIPVETDFIKNYSTVSYNPYLFIAPDWGYDVLSTRKINLTANINETPNFIKVANMSIFQILPSNATIWWNFTVIPYQKDRITAMLLNGMQNQENTSIVSYFYNVTGPELIRYRVGQQTPGLYTFTPMMLNGIEVDNASAETYSVGLTYCNNVNPEPHNFQDIIDKPGYYSFAGDKLYVLTYPYLTNDSLCDVGTIITANDVVIDCRGGSITANYSAFYISNSKNVSIENCKIYGNGIYAINSSVKVVNTSFLNSSRIAHKFFILGNNSIITTNNFTN